MSLLCDPFSLPLTTKPYSRSTKPIVSSSSLKRHTREECSKSVLPFLSAPRPQPLLSSSKTSTAASKSDVTITSPYPPCQTIEHFALFKMKQGTNLEILVDQINRLRTIPGILYLSGGLVHDSSYPSPLPSYDVWLHARFRNQQDVDAYMVSPQKLNFTYTYTEAYYEDYMGLDWFSYHPEPLPSHKLWSAMRLTLFKVDDGGWEPVYKAIKDVYGNGEATLVTYGQNHVGGNYRSHTKGFQLSSLAVFPGVYEMEALGTAKEFRTNLEKNLQPSVSEVIVVDYIVKVFYDPWM